MKSRTKVVLIIACTGISAACIIGLYAMSPIKNDIYRGRFARTFLSNSYLTMDTVIDAKFNSFYIAGADEEKIYFGNYTAPLHLLMTNHTLSDSQHVRLRIDLDSIAQAQRFRLAVDSPYFYLLHGTIPEFLRGNIGHWTADRYLGDSTDYFMEAVSIGPRSLILRSYSNSNKGYELGKKSSLSSFKFNYDLLNKQVDGIFCLDGLLMYDKYKSKVVYIHHYRNEFIVADTNLNLELRSHTIDTFSRARIKVAHLSDGNEFTLSAPALQINNGACVYKGHLYVQSNLLAGNEDTESFLTKTVIDVYSISDGQYLHSFYIPDYENYKARDFEIVNSTMIVMVDRYIISFDMNSSLAKVPHDDVPF